jgi:hypothetical protein
MSDPLQPQEFLIDDLLPAGEIHLLAGSSGSGKTTWLFQMLADWQQGKEVFGHASHPVPYAYVSVDRSRTSVTRTLQRLGLVDKITRIICREDLPSAISLGSVLQACREKHPDSKVFFIEGFQTMVGDKGNSYTPVAQLLQATTAYCAQNGLTVVGVCHSPKMKIEEGFKHPRETVLGSVAWAAFSDTVITMDLDEKTGIVNLNMLPRNAASETHQLVFSPPNGILIPPPNSPKDLLVKLLLAQDEGTELTRPEILEWGNSLGCSVRTADRAIADLVDSGELVATIHRGTYRRVTPVSN